jgi:cobalt-zinc-cadmium efflux system membrane fusion protein
MSHQPSERRRYAARKGLFAFAALLLAGGGTFLLLQHRAVGEAKADVSSRSSVVAGVFHPTAAQWDKLGVAVAETRVFRLELNTDGKIAVDEDRATPIYSPYSGRITKLLVKPGDRVERGQLLYVLEASDTVQTQNDFIAAGSALNKSRSQVKLAEIIEARQKGLYAGKAAPLKDWQQSEADLVVAQNDLRSAEVAFEAAGNRLRILGKSDDEIKVLQNSGRINPETPVFAPIAGTIVQRKVGPGQYVTAGSSDPAFVVGDLSTVWLMANVRETDAGRVNVGQAVEFRILADPHRRISGTISYVAAAVDPGTRRLPIRATIDNPGLTLKPEMFATVSIFASDHESSIAVPREALLYEGEKVRVWVVTADKGVALRQVTPGMVDGKLAQVLDGLQAGDKVITKGSLFVDRIATGNQT